MRKLALVTGVSGSIGTPIAEELLKKDYSVLGLDMVAPTSEALKGGNNFLWKPCNLCNSKEIELQIEEYCKEQGPFDVVINNVGILFSMPIISFKDGIISHHSFEDWDRIISINLSSAFYVTACTVKHMIAHGRKGIVINISSICSRGNAGQAAYSASKAGLNGFTLAIAKELGPLGIRVAGLSPGFFDTPSTQKAISSDMLSRVTKNIPLKRLGKVEEIIKGVQFILDNPYFTGKILEIDGGLTL